MSLRVTFKIYAEELADVRTILTEAGVTDYHQFARALFLGAVEQLAKARGNTNAQSQSQDTDGASAGELGRQDTDSSVLAQPGTISDPSEDNSEST